LVEGGRMVLGLKGPDYFIVALLAGTFISDTDTLPQRMQSLAKAKEQYDHLSAQAREALDRSLRSLEQDSGRSPISKVGSPEPETPGVISLIDLAHKLGVKTEGRTADEIADEIAQMAVKATTSR